MKKASLLIVLTTMGTLLLAQNLEIQGKAKITVMDKVTNVSSNVVRKNDGTLALRQYKIGDFAQGGVVFWVDETGEHGLACDISDISSGIQWYNGISKATNSRGDGVGSGGMNTMLIIAQQTADNTAGSFAALLCANLVRSSYGDWYLPSITELIMMYQNKAQIDATAVANGGTGFVFGSYWSSTEYDDTFAAGHAFYSGIQFYSIKSFSYYIRAVRAF